MYSFPSNSAALADTVLSRRPSSSMAAFVVWSSHQPELAFFLRFIYFILYAWVFCLHLYLCTLCMPGALRGQKLPDTLKLELQMVVNYHVGAEN